MSVDDHGIEALKKAAEADPPGQKAEYQFKVRMTNVSDLTVLINDVESLLTTIRDNADQLEGFTDGLEGLLTSILAAVDGLEGFVDGIEGFVDGLEGLLQGSTPVLTTITSSTSNQQILAANSLRRGLFLFNNTNKEAIIRLGSTAATTTAFTFKIQPDDYWERSLPHYTGAIQAIWGSSPTGSLLVTEITA